MTRLMAGAVLLALCGVIAAGCGWHSAQAPPPPAPAGDTSAVPDSEVDRYCRVCYVDGGHKMGGYLPERLNVAYEGKTYAFCSDDCRKKFEANPAKYALKPEKTGKEGDGQAGHDH
jgi:hypothetical protein